MALKEDLDRLRSLKPGRVVAIHEDDAREIVRDAIAPLTARISELEAAHQQVTAERDETLASQRYWSGEADRAAEELAKVRAELAEARADQKAAEDSNDALNEKLSALAPHGSCACSYDKPGDVCMHHSPALATATSELARLRAEREALRAALTEIGAMTEREFHGEDYVLPGEAPGWVERPTAVARIARTALARAATAREGA